MHEIVRFHVLHIHRLAQHLGRDIDTFRPRADDLMLRIGLGFRVARGLALEQVIAGHIPVAHARARGRAHHAIIYGQLFYRHAELHPRARQ